MRMWRTFVICIALLLFLNLCPALSDTGSSRVSEQVGKWTVSFDWPETDEYSRSVSQGTTEEKGGRVSSDTLLIASQIDPGCKLKISLKKYSHADPSLLEISSLMNQVNQTVTQEGACKVIAACIRKVDGKDGAFCTGTECSSGGTVYAISYPVDYYMDKSLRALASNAICVVRSSYDLDSTEMLIRSLHIEQIS
jgi:hypothetical protein